MSQCIDRKCKKCGKTQPLEAFVKDARRKFGRAWTCMACRRAYQRQWQGQPRAIASRAKYRREHAERYAKSSREYRKRHPDKVRENTKRWQRDNPEKRAAHLQVLYAIRSGRLKRLPCEVCGSSKSESHHDDYSKPLSVRWLCHAHHCEHEHAGIKPKRRPRKQEPQGRMF